MARISAGIVQRGIGEGRRRATRYDLRLKMRYAIVRHGVEPVTRTGESVNVSVTGLLFRAETRVFMGDSVVAVLDWPVAAPNNEPLHLVVTGYVVRARRATIAMSIASKRLLRASKVDPRFELLLGGGNAEAGASRQIVVVDADAATAGLVTNVLRPPRWMVKRAGGQAARLLVASGAPDIGIVITQNVDLLGGVPETIPVILVVEEGGPEEIAGAIERPRLAVVPRAQLGAMLPDVLERLCLPTGGDETTVPTSAA